MLRQAASVKRSKNCPTVHAVRPSTPWRLELPLPDANPFRPGSGLLLCERAVRIARPVHGVSTADEPSLNARAVRPGTVADETAVLVSLDEFAGRWRRRCQPLRQRFRRSCAAPICPAGGVCAELCRFRGVDAVEPNPLAVDFDGVAVDHRRPADNGFRPARGNELRAV